MSAIKFAYSHVPVSGRFGAGSYSYTLILENTEKIERYEIFGECIQDVFCWVAQVTNAAVVNFASIDGVTWELFLAYPVPYKVYVYLH